MSDKLKEQEKKDLLKKYDFNKKRTKKDFNAKKEMYLKQTDRNYKDGDRN